MIKSIILVRENSDYLCWVPNVYRSMQTKMLHTWAFWLSLLGLLVFFTDFGFDKSTAMQSAIEVIYLLVVFFGFVSLIARYLHRFRPAQIKVRVFDLLYLFSLLSVFYHELVKLQILPLNNLFGNVWWVKLMVVFVFIREFSERNINYKRAQFNPAQLFILSFLSIILVGSLFLMLPNATYEGIGFIDALFTATSAVCVTGLIVVDTATHFTLFGQTIIMVLIQIGGVGILTFASYFSYFFKGGSTYENQLALNDITSTQKLSEVFTTLKRILVITFTIEFFAAVLIYFSVSPRLFSSGFEHFFFAVFHSISAFCNAGFSTLTGNLYETGFFLNYPLQIVVMLTFIIGGLGFPIVSNIVDYVKYTIRRIFYSFKRVDSYKPWVLTLNSRITLITTFALTGFGFVAIMATEYNHMLQGHQGFGKVVAALFQATTPRTAGFNAIDLNSLQFSTIMLVFFLMWVGASPSSTGGGIKTSTLAIATLNLLSLAKGKTRIEVFRRQISSMSVHRSYAIISLSLIVIGASVFLISIFDSEKELIDVAFESFSAYSTVGLSLGITAQLSQMSKLVIIGVMFVGRVGMLSVLIAVFKKVKQINYQYPNQEITIN